MSSVFLLVPVFLCRARLAPRRGCAAPRSCSGFCVRPSARFFVSSCWRCRGTAAGPPLLDGSVHRLHQDRHRRAPGTIGRTLRWFACVAVACGLVRLLRRLRSAFSSLLWARPAFWPPHLQVAKVVGRDDDWSFHAQKTVDIPQPGIPMKSGDIFATTCIYNSKVRVAAAPAAAAARFFSRAAAAAGGLRLRHWLLRTRHCAERNCAGWLLCAAASPHVAFPYFRSARRRPPAGRARSTRCVPTRSPSVRAHAADA